jgi:hypothetical protein
MLGWSGFPAPREGNTRSLLFMFLWPGIVESGKPEKAGRGEYTSMAGARMQSQIGPLHGRRKDSAAGNGASVDDCSCAGKKVAENDRPSQMWRRQGGKHPKRTRSELAGEDQFQRWHCAGAGLGLPNRTGPPSPPPGHRHMRPLSYTDCAHGVCSLRQTKEGIRCESGTAPQR